MGLFFTYDDVVRFAQLFRRMPAEIAEELRGWHWSEGVLLPGYDFKLSVTDVVSEFCETGRHVYVKYVLKRREEPSPILERGGFIHAVYARAVEHAKKLIYDGVTSGQRFRAEFMLAGSDVLHGLLDGEFKRMNREVAKRIFNALWSNAANTYASALDRYSARSPYLTIDGLAAMTIPVIAEYPVDGSLIGLNRAIRIDAMLPPAIIVEMKTRRLNPRYDIGLAAYALAFESQYEIPVNYAILLNVRFSDDGSVYHVYERHVLISDALRQKFVEERDKLMQIIDSKMDPGKPSHCDPHCPFLNVCREW